MNQLFNIGFTDEEIKDILDSNPLWNELNTENVINLLLKYFKNTELKDMIYTNPYILSRDTTDLKHTIDFLLENIDKDEIISNPTILNYNQEEITNYN